MDNLTGTTFGVSFKIKKIIQNAERFALGRAPLLIVGENGVGKRSVGKYIHELSARNSNPLMILDCGRDAVEVEDAILGYRDEDGNFYKGILETANGGTIILANIDALRDSFQKRFHQILQDLNDYDISLKVIATTTKNLSKLVGAGRFYRGLFTFVATTIINIPPLRERIEDLDFFVDKFAKEHGNIEFSREAINKLRNHYWTYNMIELFSVLENITSNSGIIDESQIILGERKVIEITSDGTPEGIRLMSLKDAERILIKKALIHTNENRTQAAKILGVSIRTLRNKINEYRNVGNHYFINLR
jgi:two-component system response regulator FlrC